MLHLEFTYMFWSGFLHQTKMPYISQNRESWGSLREAVQMCPSNLGKIYQMERSNVAWEQGKQGRIEARVHLCTEKMNFFLIKENIT